MRKLMIAALVAATGVASAAPIDQKSDEVQVNVSARRGRLGIGVVQIGSALRTHFGAPADRGVIVDGVRPDSPAARAGLQTGDVILEVDAVPARSVADVVAALDKHKKGEVATVIAIRGSTHLTLLPKLDTDPSPAAQWFGTGDDAKWFATPPMDMKMFDRGMEHQLEQRLDQLEKRIQKLEHA